MVPAPDAGGAAGDAAKDAQLVALQEREEATRQKLAKLKQELQRERTSLSMSLSGSSVPAASVAAENLQRTVTLRREQPTATRVEPKPAAVQQAQHLGTRRAEGGAGAGADAGVSGAGRSAASEQDSYMTALDSQRQRVQRIRKAIKAATVIQRAWRRYKLRGRPRASHRR